MDNVSELVGYTESNAKRKVHSTKCLHKEIGEISYLTAHTKALEQREANVLKKNRSRK